MTPDDDLLRGGQGREPENISGDAHTVKVCVWIAAIVAGVWAFQFLVPAIRGWLAVAS